MFNYLCIFVLFSCVLIINAFLKLKQKFPKRSVFIWIIPLCCTQSVIMLAYIFYYMHGNYTPNVAAASDKFVFFQVCKAFFWLNAQFWAIFSRSYAGLLNYFSSLITRSSSWTHYDSTVLPLHFFIFQHDGNKALYQPLLYTCFNLRTNVCPWADLCCYSIRLTFSCYTSAHISTLGIC